MAIGRSDALTAFAKLTSRDNSDTESIRRLVLADVRKVLTGEWPLPAEGEEAIPVERIFSKTLVEQLNAMADRPWPEAQRGRPISERWLARQLGHFDIGPQTLRIGPERAKGYEAGQFSNAFLRFLPVERDFIGDTVTCEGKPAFSVRDKTKNVTGEKTICTQGMSRCHACKEGVPEKKGVEAVSDEPDKQAETLVGDESGVARL